MVRGFDAPDRDSVDSTSPTASRSTLRVTLSALATHGLVPRKAGGRTAFLQGMPLDRPTAVIAQPPAHARVPAGTVLTLRKCAYGLTDAPRRWYDSVLVMMTTLGLIPFPCGPRKPRPPPMSLTFLEVVRDGRPAAAI